MVSPPNSVGEDYDGAKRVVAEKLEYPSFAPRGASREVDVDGEAASRIEASQLMGSRAKMVMRV